jgi:hypothetical protein
MVVERAVADNSSLPDAVNALMREGKVDFVFYARPKGNKERLGVKFDVVRCGSDAG